MREAIEGEEKSRLNGREPSKNPHPTTGASDRCGAEVITASTRSTSRDGKLTSCDLGNIRSGLAPPPQCRHSSFSSSVMSSSLAEPPTLHFQERSQKAQESEILHGYVPFNSRIAPHSTRTLTSVVLKPPRQNSDRLCHCLQRCCNNHLGHSPHRLSLEAI